MVRRKHGEAYDMFSSLRKSLSAQRSELEVSFISLSERYLDFMEEVSSQFEKQHKDIDIDLFFFEDSDYKSRILSWLHTDCCPDILIWHGGDRFLDLVNLGKIECLTQFWSDNHLNSKIPDQTHHLVFRDSDVYGIPLYSYHWGFYYRKSTFSQLGLSEPEDWEDFLDVCKTLKSAGITPITLGLKDKWVGASWFDYLNMRLNGYRFHSELLTGKHSFLDTRVKRVFEYWKTLLERDFFCFRPELIGWSRVLESVVDGHAGLTLTGSYLYYHLPKQQQEDIGFFKFPIIDHNVDYCEEFPVDIAFIPSASRNKQLAQQYLGLLVSDETQTLMHDTLGTLPVVQSVSTDNMLKSKIEDLWYSHTQHAQFFDRDTDQQFSDSAIKVFAEFVKNPDADMVVEALENLRQSILV